MCGSVEVEARHQILEEGDRERRCALDDTGHISEEVFFSAGCAPPDHSCKGCVTEPVVRVPKVADLIWPDGKRTQLLEIHHDARETFGWGIQLALEGIADLLFQSEVEVEDGDNLLPLLLHVQQDTGGLYFTWALGVTHSVVLVHKLCERLQGGRVRLLVHDTRQFFVTPKARALICQNRIRLIVIMLQRLRVVIIPRVADGANVAPV